MTSFQLCIGSFNFSARIYANAMPITAFPMKNVNPHHRWTLLKYVFVSTIEYCKPNRKLSSLCHNCLKRSLIIACFLGFSSIYLTQVHWMRRWAVLLRCDGWTFKVLEHNPSDKCVCNFSMLIFISVVYFILRCAQRSLDNAWPVSTRYNHVRVCNYACVRILCRIAFDFECLLFWSRRQPHCGECFRKHNDLKLFSVRGANELVVRNYFGIVSL